MTPDEMSRRELRELIAKTIALGPREPGGLMVDRPLPFKGAPGWRLTVDAEGGCTVAGSGGTLAVGMPGALELLKEAQREAWRRAVREREEAEPEYQTIQIVPPPDNLPRRFTWVPEKHETQNRDHRKGNPNRRLRQGKRR